MVARGKTYGKKKAHDLAGAFNDLKLSPSPKKGTEDPTISVE